MRKVIDTELVQMLDSGMTQRQAAEHFNVSESAISQRVSRLKAQEPPESFQKLTDKAKSFVLAKVEGRTNLEAVKGAYDVTSDSSAKTLGSRLMKDPDVHEAIQDLMAQEGIPRRRRVQRLRDMIECNDMTAVGKGLDLAARMTGDFQPERVEIVTDIELRALIAHFSARPPIPIEEVGTAPDLSAGADAVQTDEKGD